MVLRISELERKTRKAELEELKNDLGYYCQIETTDGRKNVFVEGDKLLQSRLDIIEVKKNRSELETIRKKLKLSKKDGHGEVVIKKLEHYEILSDLVHEKKGIDDTRRVSEIKWLEMKNRVTDCLTQIILVSYPSYEPRFNLFRKRTS
jgi:hypothetical protein